MPASADFSNNAAYARARAFAADIDKASSHHASMKRHYVRAAFALDVLHAVMPADAARRFVATRFSGPLPVHWLLVPTVVRGHWSVTFIERGATLRSFRVIHVDSAPAAAPTQAAVRKLCAMLHLPRPQFRVRALQPPAGSTVRGWHVLRNALLQRPGSRRANVPSAPAIVPPTASAQRPEPSATVDCSPEATLEHCEPADPKTDAEADADADEARRQQLSDSASAVSAILLRGNNEFGSGGFAGVATFVQETCRDGPGLMRLSRAAGTVAALTAAVWASGGAALLTAQSLALQDPSARCGVDVGTAPLALGPKFVAKHNLSEPDSGVCPAPAATSYPVRPPPSWKNSPPTFYHVII